MSSSKCIEDAPAPAIDEQVPVSGALRNEPEELPTPLEAEVVRRRAESVLTPRSTGGWMSTEPRIANEVTNDLVLLAEEAVIDIFKAPGAVLHCTRDARLQLASSAPQQSSPSSMGALRSPQE